jgi:hypothetical protein
MSEKKQKFMMMSIHPTETEDTLKMLQDKETNCERGLMLRTPVGKELFKEINKCINRGYFPCAFILEDGFNMEVVFQRHPKQKDEHKFVEMKTPEELKNKL